MEQIAKNAEYFVLHLTEFMRSNSARWISTAECVKQAEEALGLQGLKAVCSQVGLSYSTARRLIIIDQSPRVRNYSAQLATTDSWGTLYEITKLSDVEFDLLRDELLTGDDVRPITRKQVQCYRVASSRHRRRVRLFSIDIDASDQLSISESEGLMEAIDQLRQVAKDKLFIKMSDEAKELLTPVHVADSAAAASAEALQ